MKYMGSKRSMLENGLGATLLSHAPYSRRVVDLFSGGGFVSWFIAENTDRPVYSVDLQVYSAILAKSVIERVKEVNSQTLEAQWINKALSARTNSKYWEKAVALEDKYKSVKMRVQNSRRLCSQESRIGPIWNAYGGHYYSPKQALTIDYLIKYLPKQEPERGICLAALIMAASKCAAAPGHTAQPFQPTVTAGPFITIAWDQDPIGICKDELVNLSSKHAQVPGKAEVGDALEVAGELGEDDLVFIDPPYSDVQYSRFYHVLETIAIGNKIEVSGIGRYPDISQRPQSNFSRKGQSKKTVMDLLEKLGKAKTKVIFTFPEGKSSNGLSGDIIIETAKKWFSIDADSVDTKFSTLGGNNNVRDARKTRKELILVMKPK